MYVQIKSQPVAKPTFSSFVWQLDFYIIERALPCPVYAGVDLIFINQEDIAYERGKKWKGK